MFHVVFCDFQDPAILFKGDKGALGDPGLRGPIGDPGKMFFKSLEKYF